MRTVLTIALYAVLAGLIATRPRADDIDIYRTGFGAEVAPLRVMLSIDLRAESAEVVCVNAAALACKSALGDDIYQELDLFGFAAGSVTPRTVEHSADGIADLVQLDSGSTITMAAGHWEGVAVDRYDLLRAALRVVLTRRSKALRQSSVSPAVEVGLLAQHADDCAGSGPRYSPNYNVVPVTGCSQGAYVLVGFTDLSDPAGLDKLLLALAALPDPGRRAPWMTSQWQGHPYQLRDIYLELYRYLAGQAVFNGFLGTADYGSQSNGNLYHADTGEVTNDVLLHLPDGTIEQALLAPALDILLPSSFDLARNAVADARYLSPVTPQESCASVAMVNLQIGGAAPSRAETSAAIAVSPEAGGLGIDVAPGMAGNRELLAAMAAGLPAMPNVPSAGGAVTVRSYFYSIGTDPAVESLAIAGGTGRAYSLSEPRDYVEALAVVFAGITRPSSSLVAASTIVNKSGGSSVEEDIFFALFQPEPGPNWPGNIKKLKTARLSGDNLEDSDDVSGRDIIAQAPLTETPEPAISAEDGKILSDALTFWTDPEGADVRAFDASLDEVPGRDGRSVTRGGAGQQITGFLGGSVGAANSEPGARQIYTLDPDDPRELLALDASTSTLARIGSHLDPGDSMDEAQALDLLRWIRGQDSFDVDGDGDQLESRGWLLGAALHSRPLAVSYGARPGTSYNLANPDVRIFFGTNDGVFHVVQNTLESGGESGQETWAFVPLELLGLQSSLARDRVNTPGYQSYGLDGEPVAVIRDQDGDGDIEANEGDTVWVFIGQRRGGRRLFAFDVTDPDSPRYMWSIDNTVPGFEQLALTFSTPRVARLDLGEAAPTAVLVFAGGYNGGWSGLERVGKDAGLEADPIGNAIYVVDPQSGSLIWRAHGPNVGATPESDEQSLYVPGLSHSIPSPVTVVDADRNGVDDRAYVADTGGNVWRMDLTEYANRQPGSSLTDASNWKLGRLASLGGSGESDRRFFHAPDVVQSRDRDGDYTGVLLLSGNRAAPGEIEVRNFSYLLKDRRTASGSNVDMPLPVTSHGMLTDITDLCAVDDATACDQADLESGWKLNLGAPGEKGLSTPLVSNGTVLFTSYVPFSDSVVEEDRDGAPRVCQASEGYGRFYAVSLGNGSPGLSKSVKIRFRGKPEEEETPELLRFLGIGPGLAGDVAPVEGGVLIPGTGLEAGTVLPVPGKTWWRAYWREEEVDTL